MSSGSGWKLRSLIPIMAWPPAALTKELHATRTPIPALQSVFQQAVDFSHLSQTGWVAHRPYAQREDISSWLHTPLFRCRRQSSKQRSERGYSHSASLMSQVG